MGMYDGLSHYYALRVDLLSAVCPFCRFGGKYIMAEFTGILLQAVEENDNVLFTETPICPTRGITHREGSGIVRVSGNGSQCRARYLVAFSGNIQIPTGGTVG